MISQSLVGFNLFSDVHGIHGIISMESPWNVHGSGALVKDDDGKVQGGDVSILNLRPADNPGGVWRYFLSREWRNIGKRGTTPTVLRYFAAL